MKITFIGGGNMATALIGGLKQQGFSAAGIQVVEPVEEARLRLTESFGVRCTAAIDASALNCEVLVLAVKPQMMRAALAAAAGKLKDQLVISIAAGLRLADIGRWLGGHRQLVRSMPNTPALIGAGITGLYADPSIGREARDTAEKILSAVGSTFWVDDEALMDAVTAVSSSGAGYVFYFMEAMERAAQELGFSAETAHRMTVETFVGAARLAEHSPESLPTLRERVTSKGGTTAAALESFRAGQVADHIVQGIKAAERRGRELCEQLGRD